MHEGEAIRQKVKEKGITVTEFADAICRSRRAVYHIFGRKKIHEELQQTISRVLNYTFTIPSHKTKKHLVIIEANEKQLQEIVSKFQIVTVYDV
jgi:uncharacterized protein YebE (UPF0316 family)